MAWKVEFFRRRYLIASDWPWAHSNSDTFSRGITALIGIMEIRLTIPSRITNWIAKQTRPLIRKVVWPVIMPVIAMWETLDLRQSRVQPTEQNAENSCRENSHHFDLVLGKPLEPDGHDIGVSTS